MSILITWYSRTGRTTKAAETIRDALASAGVSDVELEELLDTKNRAGAAGWMSGGRDATLKRVVPIEPVQSDVATYDLVVIGTPVWAFTMAPAVRTFCTEHGSAAQRVAFVATMGGSGDAGAYRDMEKLCGSKPVATLSLIDKAIDRGDEEKFIARVAAFAAELVAE